MTKVALLLMAVVAMPLTQTRAQDAADSAWRRGDIETARRLYGERLAADSADARALHRMGIILGWEGAYERSIQLLDRVLGMSPSNWEAAVDRARVYAWQGRTSRAIELLDDVLRREPAYLPALQARAQFQSWAGEYAAALRSYERLGEALPEDGSIPRDRARVLSWASRLDEAIAIYDSLVAVDPKDRASLLGLARTLAWSDELDSAISVYRAILGRDPADVEALHGLARALSWRGDLVQGEAAWRKAVEIDSANVEGLIGLCTNLRWQGRDVAAYRIIQRAARLDPVNREVLAEMQSLQTSMAPNASGSMAYENDTDGNRVTTIMAQGVYRNAAPWTLGVMAYARGLGLPSPRGADYMAFGAQLEISLHMEPGWSVLLGGGVSASDAPSETVTPRVTARMSSPGRGRLFTTMKFTHEPLDASAILVEHAVTLDQLSLNVRLTPAGGWRVSGSGSYSLFNGSERNTRWTAYGAVSKRLTRQFTVGTSLRAFGFEKDLNDGYFDPPLYLLAEVNLGWAHAFGRWHAAIEAAPGVQQVGVEGPLSGAGRARMAISFRVLPGREFALVGGYSTTGWSIFASDVGDYRYRSVAFLTKWVL